MISASCSKYLATMLRVQMRSRTFDPPSGAALLFPKAFFDIFAMVCMSYTKVKTKLPPPIRLFDPVERHISGYPMAFVLSWHAVLYNPSVFTMSAPAKPIPRDSSLVYITVSSPLSPDEITRGAAEKEANINYIGPVGELKGEHIFQVVAKDGPMKRDSPTWQETRTNILDGVRGVEGVWSATIMEEKSRSKR